MEAERDRVLAERAAEPVWDGQGDAATQVLAAQQQAAEAHAATTQAEAEQAAAERRTADDPDR